MMQNFEFSSFKVDLCLCYYPVNCDGSKGLEQIQYYSKEVALGLSPISTFCAILSLRNFLQNAWHKYQNSLLVAMASWIQILPNSLLNRACCQENKILDIFQEFYPLYVLFSCILFYNLQQKILTIFVKLNFYLKIEIKLSN